MNDTTNQHFSYVSRDALDAIEACNLKTADKLRAACVFTLLSMNTDRAGITKWGADACSRWLHISNRKAKHVIEMLQALRLGDGKPLVKSLDGKRTPRPRLKINLTNPILVPHIIKRRVDGVSFIERMFPDGSHMREKGYRLMMLIRIYETFVPEVMCCPSLLFNPEEADVDYDEYNDTEMRVAFVPTRVPITDAIVKHLSAWMSPPTLKEREQAARETVNWLADNGLVTLVRVVHNDGQIIYPASFKSSYWNTQFANPQSILRSYSDEEEPFIGGDGSLEDYPVFFTGGDLATSIAPQYPAMTKEFIGAVKDLELYVIEVVDDMEWH